MTPKAKLLLACALALGIMYVIFFTDLFRKQSMQILVQMTPGRASAIPRPRDSAPVYPVSFKLKAGHRLSGMKVVNKGFRLTSVKVVNTAEHATNRFAAPLWHVVSDSNSTPQHVIVYGAPRIPGMRSAVPRAKPQPLEAGVQYTLLVEAGKLKGQTNFVAREYVPRPGRGS